MPSLANRSSITPGAFDRSVETRRVAVPYDARMPRHFVDGDLLQSHIMATLSATFPKGEQFFVDSVRAFRDQIDDDELRHQVAGFIGQESMHGREHDRFNQVLAAMGYPTRLVDGATGAAMGLLQRALPPSVQLAVTAAAEHYTSVLAEQILEEDAFAHQDLPEDVKDLFRWHALEECEHKAVAYDVYQRCVGNEVIRLATMHGLSVLLGAVVVTSLLGTVLSDRSARNPVRFARSVLNLRRSPFARKRIALRLLEYNRPGFHPDDRDTELLVAQWREALFGPDGELNDILSRPRRAIA
jgi:uncharacterized protein